MSHAGEFSDVTSHDERKARTRHTCSACREAIEPGATYHRYGTLYDGSWSTTKQCARCRRMFDAICDATPGAPVFLDLSCGELWEDVLGPLPPEVAALAFALPGDQ